MATARAERREGAFPCELAGGKRCADIIGICPDADVILRLAGALMLETSETPCGSETQTRPRKPASLHAGTRAAPPPATRRRQANTFPVHAVHAQRPGKSMRKWFTGAGIWPHLMALTMLSGIGRLLPVTGVLAFIGDVIASLLEAIWTAFFLYLVSVPPEVAAFLSALVLAFRVTVHAHRLVVGADALEASLLSWRGALIVWGFLGYLYVSGSAAAEGYAALGAFLATNRVVEVVSVLMIGAAFIYLFCGWLVVFSNHRRSFAYGLHSLALAYAETGVLVAIDQLLRLVGLPLGAG